MRTTVPSPVVVTQGSTDPSAPLVVLLHGRGSDEREIIGLASNLPVFAGLPCRLVLVSAAAGDPARQQAAAADVASLGYDRVEFIVAPSWQAEVA